VEFVRARAAVDELGGCCDIEPCRCSLDLRGMEEDLELDPLVPFVDVCLFDP
jgi:hypothetical protein